MRKAALVAEEHANVLADWYGRKCGDRLIATEDGWTWFVKCKDGSERRRDVLAALLAKGWLNVPEVRNLSAEEIRDLQHLDLDVPALSVDNTYLVRFAFDYSVEQLPVRDPDAALAYELVFSTWIRRRDAHAYNRIFTDGIPIFFDFGTAFLNEQSLVDLGVFFKRGPDTGWAGWWRLQPVGEIGRDTYRLRCLENMSSKVGEHKVLLPVESYGAFLNGLDRCAAEIAALPSERIFSAIEQAGFVDTERDAIQAFLARSQRELPDALEWIQSTVLDPS